MKHVLKAGTDAASLLIFDPVALPADFDERMRNGNDCLELLREVEKAGQAHGIYPGGDGVYLLHVFVGEPVAPHLREYLSDPVEVARLPVPSGRLFFSGAEYAFHKDESQLRHFPHMEASCAIPPGSYRLTLHRTEYPDDLLDNRLRQAVPSLHFRLFHAMGSCVGAAVLAMFTMLATFFFLGWGPWLKIVVPVTGACVLAPIFLSRVPAYRQTQKRLEALELDYPSLIAELQPIAGETAVPVQE